VWDWLDRDHYDVHLYITVQNAGQWTAHHFASRYRCLQRAELTEALAGEGFEGIRWLMPQESGSYLPVVLARRGCAA